MTRFINRPEDHELRQNRICMPQRIDSPLFQGWGPKF
jgi:hypothetical protein